MAVLEHTDSDLSIEEVNSLEFLIDKHNIQQVLIALSEICGARAEQAAHLYQQAGGIAKAWATVEGAIAFVVTKAGGL